MTGDEWLTSPWALRKRPLAWTAVTIAATLLAGCGGYGEVASDDASRPPPDSATPHHSATSSTASQVQPEAIEQAIHARINAIRTEHGLTELQWQVPLAAVARAHSRDMAQHGSFSHQSRDGRNFGDRYLAAGFRCQVPIDAGRYSTGGENIAQTHLYAGVRTDGYGRQTPIGWRSADEIAARAVDGWMASPGHRENILRPYFRSEAIGVAFDNRGRVFVTQNFC